jgi:hypothetical protein
VVRACYAIADDLAVGERTATMDARVAKHVRITLGVAEGDEVEPHNLDFQGSLVCDLVAQSDRIPKIDVHLYLSRLAEQCYVPISPQRHQWILAAGLSGVRYFDA